jgi:hypothetical protein
METRPGDPKHGDFARAAGRRSPATSGSARSPTAKRPSPTTSARARTAACTSSSASTTGFASARSRSHSSSPTPRRTRSRSASQEMATDECHGPQVRRPRRCDGPHAPPPLPHPRPGQPDARADPLRPGGHDLLLPELLGRARPRALQPRQSLLRGGRRRPGRQGDVLASNGYTDTSMGGGTKPTPALS